jgi:hypothetical protein
MTRVSLVRYRRNPRPFACSVGSGGDQMNDQGSFKLDSSLDLIRTRLTNNMNGFIHRFNFAIVILASKDLR